MTATTVDGMVAISTPARPRVPAGAWWALGVLTTLYVFSYLDRYLMTMLVSDMQASLRITDSQMGVVLGPAFALFYAIFSIPFGWAADRYSRRVVIFAGSVMFGFATAASGLANSFAALLAARIFVAIGEASLGPSALALIADKFPRERLTTAVSIFSTGTKIGGTVAYGIGGVTLIAMAAVGYALPRLSGIEPWRLTFFLIGLVSALVALLVFTFRESGDEPGQPRHERANAGAAGAIAFFRREGRLLTLLLVGFSAMSICGNALIAWLPTHAHRTFNWSPAVYGPILSAISFAGAGSLVVKGMIMDWFFRRGVKDIHVRFYSWLVIGTLPLALGVFLIRDGAWFFGLYSIVGVVTIPWVAYASVVMQVITPPEFRGRVWGAVSIPLITMGGIGPLLVGLMTDKLFGDEAKVGWSLALLLAVFLPIALVCMRASLPALRRAVERNERLAA